MAHAYNLKEFQESLARRLREAHAAPMPDSRLAVTCGQQQWLLRLDQVGEILPLSVTGGNITPVTDQLVKEGLVERVNLPDDRRAWLVRLTPAGRQLFKKMAKRHEAWIVHAFASLNSKDMSQLHALLGQVKQHSVQLASLESP